MKKTGIAVAKKMLDSKAVRIAYKRWAPVYDYSFGQVARFGRLHAVKTINRRKGSLLEVGVGTGLSLPSYGDHLELTGIDLSPEMLSKARKRVKTKKLKNVAGLYEMDAGKLEFPEESFDTVVAMYVMTVVPEPETVMQELARVCAPGGEVILVNHFSSVENGVRAAIERKMVPYAKLLGWRPVFPIERVLGLDNLRLVETKALHPLGLFTMLRFVKQPQIPEDARPQKIPASATAGLQQTSEAAASAL